MHILPEKDCESLGLSDVHYGTRRVPWCMEGLNRPVSQEEVLFRPRQLPIDGEGLKGCVVPAAGCNDVIALFQKGCLEFMSDDHTLKLVLHCPGTTGVVEVAVGDQKVFNLLWIDSALAYIIQEVGVSASTSERTASD